MASVLLKMWHPLIDALFAPSPLQHRGRLLFLLPVSLVLYTWKAFPYIFSRPYVVCQIPTRRPRETIRALVYNHPSRCSKPNGDRKRPLHIDIHGGGFIGGIPEEDVPFCTDLAKTTGAVVVSVTYRLAPRHPFPAAHDDVADALAWLVENGASEFEVDTRIVTVSGFSAGGNLALGATLGAKDSQGEKLIKGAVTFYNPVRPHYLHSWRCDKKLTLCYDRLTSDSLPKRSESHRVFHHSIFSGSLRHSLTHTQDLVGCPI